jgi:hypothetical protein
MAAGTHQQSTTAVCISGQFRTFDLPCAGELLVRRYIIPLHADVFAFMNAPSKLVNASYAAASRILAGTSLQMLEVVAADSTPSISSTVECPKHPRYPTYKYGIAFAQSLGLMQCGIHAVPRGYDWIVRVRPDGLQGFIMPPVLPKAVPSLRSPRGFAIVGFSSGCGCDNVPSNSMCRAPTLCACAHDSFAMIHGHEAQYAYFVGYADDYKSCARPRLAANGSHHCSLGAMRQNTPECQLGCSLASRRIPVFVLGWLFRRRRPFSSPYRVKGPSLCAAFDNYTATSGEPPYTLDPKVLDQLPFGPTSEQQLSAVCALPRRPGWELLCA